MSNIRAIASIRRPEPTGSMARVLRAMTGSGTTTTVTGRQPARD